MKYYSKAGGILPSFHLSKPALTPALLVILNSSRSLARLLALIQVKSPRSGHIATYHNPLLSHFASQKLIVHQAQIRPPVRSGDPDVPARRLPVSCYFSYTTTTTTTALVAKDEAYQIPNQAS